MPKLRFLDTGGVSGVVVDSSGALVPGASVVITGAAGPRSVVAQSNGTYSLDGLAPGRYTIKVAFPGFVPAEKTVDIAGSIIAIVPIKLTVAAEKQSVTVSGQSDPALSVEASLNFNVMVNNVLNYLNKGGRVGNLSSPLFGQSTAIYLQRETSNDRLVQFGTQLIF